MTALIQVEQQRIVPVLRCQDATDAVSTARAVARAGLTVVELTFTTPGVLDAVPSLVNEGLTVAVGTVTAAEQVHAAAAAGAALVVSFASPDGFIAAAQEAGVVAIPGALTPSEIQSAHAAGAPAVKLFPARLAGVAMLSDMRAVLPDLRLLPTGGVSIADAPQWLAAGALAIGLGATLGTVARDGADEVEHRCRQALRAVADAVDPL
jgi:2-dehydro-3-deoxyphosphogluconate aldolase/(4S)-4-hydroxy-2-oxoglutarate aldolase